MPTYEYQCQKCPDVIEVFQNISAKPLKRCPQCGAAVRRLIGRGSGVLFKGTGFYETDYRSSQYKKRASEEKNAAGSKSGDSATSSGADKKSTPARE